MNFWGISMLRVFYVLIGVLNPARSLPCLRYVFVLMPCVCMCFLIKWFGFLLRRLFCVLIDWCVE